MEINISFTLKVDEATAARINDESDELDAMEVASTLNYNINSPYVAEVIQCNDYEVID